MDSSQIKEHWSKWANQFKTDLKATTHTDTIKKLEINALFRAIKRNGQDQTSSEILEVGCGNGYNCLSLAELLPGFKFTGIDYVPEMIDNARKLKSNHPELANRVNFQIGDVLRLHEQKDMLREYDFIFTDRCLINLNTSDLQIEALEQLIKKLKSRGYLLVLENSEKTYRRQNDCREAVGLPKRKPAEYNLFINEEIFLGAAQKKMELLHIEDFGSLHDILLYVLVPMINGGIVDYQHPIVNAAADLTVSMSEKYGNAFGDFGQNRLYVFKKRA